LTNFLQLGKIGPIFNRLQVKSTLIYLFAGVVSASISIIINPFMAKHLSPKDYAILGYFNSFNLFILPLINFSLIAFYQRNYYRIPEDQKKKVGDTILVGLSVLGLLVLLLTLIFFFLFLKWSKVSFPFFPYVLLSFTPIYLSNFSNLYLVKCRLETNARKYTFITIATSVISAGLAIVLVVFNDLGAEGRMIATLLASLAAAAYCFKQLFVKVDFDWKVIKDAVSFGWPLSMSALLWYFLDGVDRTMLEKLNDHNLLGYYSVGFQIASYLTIFSTAITNALEPDIYRSISYRDNKKLIKTVSVLIGLTALPNLVFIWFAPFFIGLLTFNRYIPSSGFAQIFALNNIAVCICFTSFSILVGFGYTKTKFFLLIIGAILSVAIYKIMIHHNGFYGAAWGHVFSVLSMSLLVGIFVTFKLKGKFRILDKMYHGMRPSKITSD
jgi:O-antigen/teichoic acid export membrane protein